MNNKVYNIDEYIEQAKNMKNTSDGGSAAYHFEDVVLVKYTIPSKYGDPRENEEKIAEVANEKRVKGVRTPYHLAIKREEIDGTNICWVLQERAKGISFSKYSSNSNDPITQLILQKKLLNAPNYHYENCIKDLCELFHMGLELKAKNIYYDDSKENGGFTFIDLLECDPRPLNPNSIYDILQLCMYIKAIFYVPLITSYSNSSTSMEKEKSQELFNGMIQKIFIAMEKIIPNFEQYRRWVLRNFSQDTLTFFEKSGIFVGDLKLNAQDYKQFDLFMEAIINDSLEKIINGQNEFWQIRANEIRIALDCMGMQDAWVYHKANTIKRCDYENDYDYKNAMKKDLGNKVNDIFNKRLEELAKTSTNINILKAKEELDKEKSINEGKKAF